MDPISWNEFSPMAAVANAPLLNAQYNVIELLGEGGMGRVYRAEHRHTGQAVAIKALRSELTADSVFRTRFLVEAQVLSRLDHPCITHLLNYIEESDGRLFLVMPYIAGRTLEQAIEQVGPFPPAVAMTLMHDILEAFAYAHRQGIIHRDIKPANIVVLPTGGIKIMDFGIARVQSGVKITTTGDSLGSPAYMSPEQVTGGEIDSRCDIYSLGVMLFEMMTGDLPFPGSNGYLVMKAHVENPIPDPREKTAMPDSIADVVMWAMAKEPSIRPSTADEMATRLPTADELGGSEVASWTYVLQDGSPVAGGGNVAPTSDPTLPPKPRRPSRPRLRPLAPLPASYQQSSKRSTNPISPVPPSPFPTTLVVVIVFAMAVTAAWLLLRPTSPTPITSRASDNPHPGTVVGAFPGQERAAKVRMVGGSEMVYIEGHGEVSPFYLDRTETTLGAYQAYLRECPVGSACGPSSTLPTLTLGADEFFQVRDHPVSSVPHRDAEAFCQWTGRRLPTSAEWTLAATLGQQRTFPWGEDPQPKDLWIAVAGRTGESDFFRTVKLQPSQLRTISVHNPRYYVDEAPSSVFGLGANVAEWLSDAATEDASLRQVAGGSWSTFDVSKEAKVGDRLFQAMDSTSSSIGFRCASSVEVAMAHGKPSRLDAIEKNGSVRIGCEAESPPMYYQSDDGKAVGFEYLLMQHLATSLGQTLKVVNGMYPDLPARVIGDHIDLIVSAYTPDTSIRGLSWSDSYLEYGLCMVVKRGSPLKSIQDLKGKTIGHYNDPATAKTIKQLIPDARKILSYETRYLEDVSEGKLDAFIYDFPFVQTELMDFRDTLYISQFGLTEATYNVGVPESEWSLMRKVNQAIITWRKSAEYAQAIKDYLGNSPPVDDIPPGARTTLVKQGDTLSAIAERDLGGASRWPEIWELNKSRLGNQNLLYVGSPLLLPER